MMDARSIAPLPCSTSDGGKQIAALHSVNAKVTITNTTAPSSWRMRSIIRRMRRCKMHERPCRLPRSSRRLLDDDDEREHQRHHDEHDREGIALSPRTI